MDNNILPIVVENAKTVSKPLGTAVGTTLSDVWQVLVGDKVARWRIKNLSAQNALLLKEIAVHGNALRLDSLPESYAYRWFERASEEDEPELQLLFAKLLANAASGNADALLKQNIDLVSRLTPNAAKLLDTISQIANESGVYFLRSGGISMFEIRRKIRSISMTEFRRSGDLLASLMVIRIEINLQSLNRKDVYPHYLVYLTDLGIQLLGALWGDGKSEGPVGESVSRA